MRAEEAKTASDTGQASGDFQTPDLATEFRYKSGISGKQPLRCERVNEITFKITDGEMTRVPVSHGQWSGYNTTKARAWVINVGNAAWLARCDDRASGPLPFKEAKAAAVAMAKGASGDYRISDPVEYLNALQAKLTELQVSAPFPHIGDAI
jgi:hypothetical protein